MYKLPKQYLNNMQELLKDEYDDYLNSFNRQQYYGLRINTNKISVDEFLKISPFSLKPIPWTNDGFYYDINEKPSKHPYYYAGLYYLQEPSAMLPAEVLPVNENDIILDACSAPGGKSSKLANKLNGSGLIISNDISVSRLKVVLKTIETQGITNSIIMAEDISKIDRFDEAFDKILVDAPCSGEGMFRKDKELIKTWRNDDYYPTLQKQILAKAITMLKPGGQLVYSTCTFNPKENEEVIEYVLDKYPELSLQPIKRFDGFASGISDKTKECVRLYPHRINGEGHFVALLHKQGNLKTNNISQSINKPDLDILNDIDDNFFKGNIVIRENKYYLEPNHNLSLDGLRIIRSGLYLGEIKHDNFEPSQALAMALNINKYGKILNLDMDDPRVLKYLKCETLNVKDINEDGYYLICIEDKPLGFAKLNKGIFKNKYPSNYRYQ